MPVEMAMKDLFVEVCNCGTKIKISGVRDLSRFLAMELLSCTLVKAPGITVAIPRCT